GFPGRASALWYNVSRSNCDVPQRAAASAAALHFGHPCPPGSSDILLTLCAANMPVFFFTSQLSAQAPVRQSLACGFRQNAEYFHLSSFFSVCSTLFFATVIH